MHQYNDLKIRKHVPQWVKYTGLIVLFLATAAVVVYAFIVTP